MKNNVQEVLRRASSFLVEQNREPKIAEILLQHHLDMTKTEFIMSHREEVPESVKQAFLQDVEEHVKTGIPVQHLIGKEEFYSREFFVNKDVLIPRPETEELVLTVLERVKSKARPLKLIDIGTGSGIIAITCKLEDPTLTVTAADISSAALSVAKKNAENLEAEISFVQSDFLTEWLGSGETFDLIISNPPYIPWQDEATLSDTVKNFDPHLALFADDNGLYAYQQIIKQAKKVLSTCGLLAFEIGYQQGEQVKMLIKQTFPESTVEIRKDINGRDRIVLAQR
ncbi:release factor glutamine methyltransferase [Natronobacillus azotifigens]|uniref:Release factor glutamine methyltransferase n=1 Tax=Natronobacillus azotifigens TaxID=472978 RepID=A0A9J6RDV9_9BACI|nr:peptide chain release factor N(5)-glutamine methyltransferase [Natronobacillus azotifigens]MCZ0703653.1 peptide chain release factor N(5)-glutamine methyltransferase [Natronobacillus azotifigens]